MTTAIGPGVESVSISIFAGDPAGGDWDEVAWDAGTWAGYVWLEVGCQVLEAVSRWGTGQEAGVLTLASAGELDLSTYDPDRLLDPINDRSPYFGALTPGRPVRINALLPAGQSVAGSGFIDSAEYDLASATGRIRAVDGVAMLAMAQLPAGVTLPATLRARVRAIVAAVALGELVTVEADTPEMGSDPPVAAWDSTKAGNAWAAITAAATDALVYVWVDPSSVLRFADFGAFPAAPFAIGCPPAAPPVADYRATIMATSGLVAYWRLGEASGVAAADETGVNPAAYRGTVTYGVPGAVSGGDTGITLNGNAANYVTTLAGLFGDPSRPRPTPAASNLNVGDIFTLEAWVNRNGAASGGWNGILSKGGGAFYLRMDGSSGVLALLSSQTAGIATSTAGVPQAAGWHHVVATKDGAAVHLYIDAADVTGAVTNATVGTNPNSVSIGGDTFGAGISEPFSGSIDEPAIYNRALTPAEVSAHFAAATAGPPPETGGPWLVGLSTLSSTFAGDGIRNSVRALSGNVWTDPIVDEHSQALYGPRPFDVDRLPPNLATWAGRILADRAGAAYSIRLGELRPYTVDELALIVELGLQGASSVRIRDDEHGNLIDYVADIVGAQVGVTAAGWAVAYQTMLTVTASTTPA